MLNILPINFLIPANITEKLLPETSDNFISIINKRAIARIAFNQRASIHVSNKLTIGFVGNASCLLKGTFTAAHTLLAAQDGVLGNTVIRILQRME